MRIAFRLSHLASALFRRNRDTARLDAELQFHLDQQIAENIAAGMTPADARATALRSFGNPTLLREQTINHWGWNSLERLLRDIRYGFRTLGRAPGFTSVAILVMALGIGATASLFSIVHAVLMQPLPFRDPDNLVMVYEHFRNSNLGDGYNMVSSGDYFDWRSRTHGFEDLAARRNWKFNLTSGEGQFPEVIQAAAGSANLLPVLGVQPALGRWFTPEEDHPQGNAAVLTWSLFQRRFAANPAILGQTIRLDARPYTIVGVLPPAFTYPEARIQLWVPYASVATPEQLAQHDMHQSWVIARLRPGISAASAISQVSALQYQLHLQHLNAPVAEEARTRPVLEDMTQDVKTPLFAMLGAVLCLLLIACLNVSNLLVARSAARTREFAIRAALGASRLALIREQLVESFLISLAGGTLGVALSTFATRWLTEHWKDMPRGESVHVDFAVLLFATGLVFVTALLAGLLPALSTRNTQHALQESSRSVGGSVSRAFLRKTLLSIEIALTVVLLIAAGLLFKSFLRLRSDSVGATTTNMLTMSYSLPDQQYDSPDKIVHFHQQLLERVRRLPGVQAAGLGNVPPGAGHGDDYIFSIPERPQMSYDIHNDALTRLADPGYFSTLQIPLIAGRLFTDHDQLDHSNFVIVSQQLARQFFPGESPLTRHVFLPLHGKLQAFEIIGVVGDTLYWVGEPRMPTMYFPAYSGQQGKEMSLIVRTATDPLPMSLPIQKQIAAIDPSLPVSEILTMQQIIGRSTLTASFSATLVLAFAILSLLLAAIGLYGVLSFLVTQRTTEIGIRMALGAQRSQVLSLVLRDGAQPVLAGLFIGIAAGLGSGQLLRSLLFGIRPLDPGVYALVIGTLLLAAALACLIPALRATATNPMQALRTE
jgi:predicted permease